MRFVVCNFWSAPRVTPRRRINLVRSIKPRPALSTTSPSLSSHTSYQCDVLDSSRHTPANDPANSLKTA